jgi:heptosyltransferase-1
LIAAQGSTSIDRLLIVRLSAMGDVIHTLPAAQALRDAFPSATIGWIVEERWAELLCAPGTPRRGSRSRGRPLVDWVHVVRLTGWRKSLFDMNTVEQIARVWNDVRSVRYQVALDLQGAIRSAVLARLSGAPVVYGARQTRESPATLFYTRQQIARGTHVVEQNLALVEAVAGSKSSPDGVDLPRDLAAEQHIEQRLADAGVRQLAIINPGAGWGAKRWPAERYGAVARALACCGLQSIVNYGPGEDQLAREAEESSKGAAKAFALSITELIALTRRAKLFVGGDTGPLHLAAALQVPIVAIFGPTDPARNGPYGTRSIVLRNPTSPTSHARRVQPDEGMLEITVDSVIDAARRLLTQTGAKRG